jgi:transposase
MEVETRNDASTQKASAAASSNLGVRDVLDAIFYVLISGCHWRLLPHDFPPWPTVYYHFRRARLNRLWSLILKSGAAAVDSLQLSSRAPTTSKALQPTFFVCFVQDLSVSPRMRNREIGKFENVQRDNRKHG